MFWFTISSVHLQDNNARVFLVTAREEEAVIVTLMDTNSQYGTSYVREIEMGGKGNQEFGAAVGLGVIQNEPLQLDYEVWMV